RALRWGEFGQASKMTTTGYRQTFLGKYEERGEDFDIVNLEVKNVERVEVDRRRVTVEQQSVTEPNMTVDKEEIIELWKRSDSGWELSDRMPKREWKRRQKRKDGNESDKNREGT
ncbi:MAG: hypothetical protein ABEN55_15420, partial [Bradymonadaceae bacterium]